MGNNIVTQPYNLDPNLKPRKFGFERRPIFPLRWIIANSKLELWAKLVNFNIQLRDTTVQVGVFNCGRTHF